MSIERPSAILVLLAAASLLAGAPALGEPLDKDSCAGLQTQRKQLLTKDMQTALDQGPDWVKTHLNETEIEQVRQFLGIEEQIEFRCRGGGVAKATVAPPPVEVPLPDRKPTPSASPTPSANSSQALADQDKTAPAKPKATR